jgi:hypothetical protein
MSFDAPLPPYNASDPTATFLNSSCLDLLMIELVPMAYRVVNEVDSGADFALVKSQPEADRKAEAERERKEGREGQDGNANGNGRKMDEDEERDAVFFRLEMLGYRVGQGLVERYVFYHSFRIEE